MVEMNIEPENEQVMLHDRNMDLTGSKYSLADIVLPLAQVLED